jgi:hypothetical protein
MNQENQLQKSEWTLEQVIDDTRVFCQAALNFESAEAAIAAAEGGTYLDEIARGFEGFRSHLFRQDYSWSDFQGDFRQILDVLDAIEKAT